jgi:hypothetical protein
MTTLTNYHCYSTIYLQAHKALEPRRPSLIKCWRNMLPLFSGLKVAAYPTEITWRYTPEDQYQRRFGGTYRLHVLGCRMECVPLRSVPRFRPLGAGFPPRGPGFLPRALHVFLWWTKWHWDRLFSEFFCFFLSV